MDSDGQDKGEDNGKSPEVSPFDLPRMGSPFEPTRLGSFFGRGRVDAEDETETSTEPVEKVEVGDNAGAESAAAEVAANSDTVDHDEVVAATEGERVEDRLVEPVVAAESERSVETVGAPSRPSEQAEVDPEAGVEEAAAAVLEPATDQHALPDPEPDTELDTGDDPDSLDVELLSAAVDGGSEAELEADVEPRWHLDVEPAPLASDHELVEAESSEVAAVERFDDESFEDEVDAEVIEFASYVEAEAEDDHTAPDETGADVIELDADSPVVEVAAQVIDLTAEPPPAPESGADVIDVEFPETNVISLGPLRVDDLADVEGVEPEVDGEEAASTTEPEQAEVAAEAVTAGPELDAANVEASADPERAGVVVDTTNAVQEPDGEEAGPASAADEAVAVVDGPSESEVAPEEEPVPTVAAAPGADTDAEALMDDDDDQEFGHEPSPKSEPAARIDDLDRSPAVPMYSVGAAIDILDSESDDADELLDSEDGGVLAPEISVEADDTEADDTAVAATDTTEPTATELAADASDGDLGSDVRDDLERTVATETVVGADAEATTPAGMPTLDDLRTMALDLDDIDSILERLDNDPDSLDVDAPPPVEQTLDLSLSD